jgi:hypothetical protein
MTTIRILGSALDEALVDDEEQFSNDYYVDMSVESVTIDGTVTLVETVEDNPRSVTIQLESLNSIRDTSSAILHEDLFDANHELWDHLEALYRLRNDDAIENVTRGLDTNAEAIFKTTVESNERSDEGGPVR